MNSYGVMDMLSSRIPEDALAMVGVVAYITDGKASSCGHMTGILHDANAVMNLAAQMVKAQHWMIEGLVTMTAQICEDDGINLSEDDIRRKIADLASELIRHGSQPTEAISLLSRMKPEED